MIEASSVGSDGIRKFEKRKAKINLTMIDSSLPDVRGLDLAKKIKGINGRTPIILIKGRGRNLDPGELEKNGVDFIVTKPFHMEHTLNLVERAMIPLQDSNKSGGG
jgi:DNA-binding response OmpR family regulator